MRDTSVVERSSVYVNGEIPRPIGFPEDTRIEVRQVPGSVDDWTTLHEIEYVAQRETFRVPVGQATDFASVPRILIWFIPRYGTYTPAAILHDYLWRELVPQKKLTRSEADGLLLQAMRQLGVPFLRRWMVWTAVRLASFTKADSWRSRSYLSADWWLELVRIVFFLALGVWLLWRPVAYIAVALAIYYGLELAVGLLLKAGQRMQHWRGKPAKRVNPPEVRSVWTT